MPARRYAEFHAGAVCVGQQGILLPGPRRCGKSTLTLGLLLKGGRYLSEDVAIVDHRSLQLTPCGSGVSLRRDGMTVFPEAAGRWTPIPPVDDGDPHQQVAFVSPDQVGSQVSEPCEVGLIVFPVYAVDGPSADLEPLSGGQAVLRLLESCISLGADIDCGLEFVIALTEKADAYVLRYHDARHARDKILDRATERRRVSFPARGLAYRARMRWMWAGGEL
jgi:hypothetical protein